MTTPKDNHALEETLAYTFSDPSLLQVALTHPSYAAEQPEVCQHNQRLEFLGDAVLQLAVTDLLYRRFPERDEGDLTKLRSAMTNDDTLAAFADELDLGSYVFLGKGEVETGGRERSSTVSDAFEAVLGAVYLDGGFDAALQICFRLSRHVLAQGENVASKLNPKGVLQELTQEMYQTVPAYETTRVSGPEHLPEFEVVVKIDDRILGTGHAGNRKTAEKQAAAIALSKLQND